MSAPSKAAKPGTDAENRRGFLKRACAGIIGAVLGIVPIGAGLNFWLNPLRRKAVDSGRVRVTALEALPDDGIPRKFQVVASKVDAWNKFTDIPVGAVYLRRLKEGRVEAFNAVCPHAGCFVNFKPERGVYSCPCHESTFNVTGQIENPASPSPRGLDSLEVEVREGKEVWVKFQNFQAGTAKKVPIG